MFYQFNNPHNGCKAIEPSYTGFNVNSLKVRMQKQISTLSPMLKKTEDSEKVVYEHIFKPTMDVKPLTYYYAGYITIQRKLGNQKHVPSGAIANSEEDHGESARSINFKKC